MFAHHNYDTWLYVCTSHVCLSITCSIAGRETSAKELYLVTGLVCIPLFYLAGAGSAVFWIIGMHNIYTTSLSGLCYDYVWTSRERRPDASYRDKRGVVARPTLTTPFYPSHGSRDRLYQAFLSLSASSFFSASQILEEGEEGLGTRLGGSHWRRIQLNWASCKCYLSVAIIYRHNNGRFCPNFCFKGTNFFAILALPVPV